MQGQTEDRYMIIGMILACMTPMDVSSCTVVFYDQKQFVTMNECQTHMNDFARYAAVNYGLITKPYCFQITNQSI